MLTPALTPALTTYPALSPSKAGKPMFKELHPVFKEPDSSTATSEVQITEPKV